MPFAYIYNGQLNPHLRVSFGWAKKFKKARREQMESKLSNDGHFICLRCHQKCHLKAVMDNGKIEEACIKAW